MSSQLIFNDGTIKSRLIKKEKGYFIAEWKYNSDVNEGGEPNNTGTLIQGGPLGNYWWPWLLVREEDLTEQEKAWAK